MMINLASTDRAAFSISARSTGISGSLSPFKSRIPRMMRARSRRATVFSGETDLPYLPKNLHKHVQVTSFVFFASTSCLDLPTKRYYLRGSLAGSDTRIWRFGCKRVFPWRAETTLQPRKWPTHSSNRSPQWHFLVSSLKVSRRFVVFRPNAKCGPVPSGGVVFAA
jgi:hypothetical protein